MSIADIWLLAVALAMDCFAVSVVSSVLLRRVEWGVVLRMSLLFGLFQALMPLAGWLMAAYFAQYVEAIGHWIAFFLLSFVGGRMVWESFRLEENHAFNPRRLRTQLLLAVATSIDALSVGVSFAFMGYHDILSLGYPLLVIGLVSFLFGVTGHLLGARFGQSVSRRVRPELIGGLILIAIGLKVLLA